jgi:fructuronate reductase
MQRLSPTTQHLLNESVARPQYDPSGQGVGIVHLGVGAFHRAHQAVYTDSALAMHGGDWRIAGVSLRSSTAAEQLNPQGGLYTVASIDDQSCDYRVVGAIERVIAAAQDSHEAIELMAAPQTKIVSLTVTEKGYCHNASTGNLAAEHPDIVADLNDPQSPRTAAGYIVEALRRRRECDLAGFTVLSCDNLPNNGAVARQVIVEYSALLDKDLSRWIEHNVTFPSSMVDRICPATTAADREKAANVLGLVDHGLVVAEPFSQWVIEDQFCNGRPRWDDVGAEMVADVAPYETAKLRLLNASHSALAFIGCLEGHEFIHEVIRDDNMAAFVRHLMEEEVRTTLQEPDGFDIGQYIESIVERFGNSALPYRTAQVATDASQKLPQRLVGTAMDRLDANEEIDAISLAIAAWIRCVTAEGERGRRSVIDDPLNDQLAKLPSSTTNKASDVVDAVLRLADIFEPRAAGSAVFRNSLVASLDAIVCHGAGGAVRQLETRFR